MPTLSKTQTATTKRRAKVPAKNNPTIETKSDPQPVRKPREFTKVQEVIIDAVSDMLINGGHRDSMDTLVMAAADHYARQIFRSVVNDPEELERHVGKRRAELEPEWRMDLEVALRANKRAPEPERQLPADVSGRIRAGVRSEVRGMLDFFLAEGTPEEMNLMLEVLRVWENFATATKPDQIPLAAGFEWALSRAETYIKVPERLLPTMQAYLNCLRAVEISEGKVV